MANTANVDRNGVAAINNFLSESSCLVSAIRSGDKDPLFDGEILVYDEKNKDENKGFVNSVKVQVKSSQKKINPRETFSMKRMDLEKYRNVGGIIFFRPIFKSVTDYRIYVKVLLPVDITEILQKAKNGSKSISVELHYCEHVAKLELLINHFLENQKHQFDFDSEAKGNITIGEDEYLVLKAMGKKNDRKMFFNSYMYIKDKRGHLHPTSGRISSFEPKYNASVLVGEKEFFKSYKIRMQKSNDVFVLNSALEIELNKESIKTSITADENTCFIDLLDAIIFMQAVASQGEFHTADGAVKDKIDGTFDNDGLLKFLSDTNCLLDKYKIDKDNLLFSDVIANETVTTMLTEKRGKANNATTNVVLDIKDFFTKKLLLVLIKLNDGSYSCRDFILDNLEDGVFHVDNIKCSKYIYLFAVSEGKLHEYIDIFVGNEESILSDLKENYTSDQFSFYNNFSLECIKGYDKNQASSILDIAKEILVFINQNETLTDNKEIITINNYQVLYRMNLLSDDDKRNMYNLKKASSNVLEICCLNILLDNFIEFEDAFNELSKEKQENFKTWPIWKLYYKSDNAENINGS